MGSSVYEQRKVYQATRKLEGRGCNIQWYLLVTRPGLGNADRKDGELAQLAMAMDGLPAGLDHGRVAYSA